MSGKKMWAVSVPWPEGGKERPKRITEVCEAKDEARERAEETEGAEAMPAPYKYDVWLIGEEGEAPSRAKSSVSWEEASSCVADDPEGRAVTAHRMSKGAKAGVSCACVLAACLAGGGAYAAWSAAQPEPGVPRPAMQQYADKGPSEAELAEQERLALRSVVVPVTFDIEGWDAAEDGPIFFRVTGSMSSFTPDEQEAGVSGEVDEVQEAMTLDTGAAELRAGDYTVAPSYELIAASDGAVYRLKNEPAQVTVSFQSDSGRAEGSSEGYALVDGDAKVIAAASYSDAADPGAYAAKLGVDEVDAAQCEVEKVDVLSAANFAYELADMAKLTDDEARAASGSRDDPEAALKTIDARRAEARGAADKAEEEAQAAGGEVEYDAGTGEYVVRVPPADGGAAGGNAGGSGSTGGGVEGAGKPAHVHTWVNDYDSRYVVDEPAWDEPVYDTVIWCNDCGKAVDISHFESHPHSYTVKEVQVDTIHHSEQGHYEDVYAGKHCSTCGAKG